MEETISTTAEIGVTHGAVPIRFAHRKSMDRPENHVLHLNNHLELYFYVSGNHRYIVENSLYELRRGDVVIINPREVHKALPAGVCLYERFYLLVDEHALDAMAQNPLSPILQKPAHAGNLISPDEDSREELLRLLYEIESCFLEGRNAQVRALGYVLQILDLIALQLHSRPDIAESTVRTPPLLERILSYVALHAATVQSTEEIAAAIGITPQYLSGYFSRRVGTPLKTYIQAKKIALAKDLLDKGADVTRTCYECGFNDCSYFIRIFKRYVGMTPLAYQRKATRDAAVVPQKTY